MKPFSRGTAPASKILISVGFMALAFCAGVYAQPVELKASLTTAATPTVECKLMESHTIQYIDRPATAAESVEQVQTIPATPSHFSSLEELRQWLVAVDTKTTTIYFQYPEAMVDCDDYALDLQRQALADGYIISFEIIGRSEYNALFSTELSPTSSLHAINLAVIGNEAYYLEPQTGEIVLAIRLD
jgi:hypothetical protein